MNRILTDLRNRLSTEHLEKLMRISIEGPSDLNNDLKDYEKFRFNLHLLFSSQSIFSHYIGNRRSVMVS